jgi:hypothetical protein
VIEAQRRHLRSAEKAACEKPTVPDDNIALAVSQNWDIEIKGLDAVGNLPESLMPLLPVRSTSCKGEAGARRRCRGGIGMLRVGCADG